MGDGFLATFDGPARASAARSAWPSARGRPASRSAPASAPASASASAATSPDRRPHRRARVAAAGAGQVLVSRTVTDCRRLGPLRAPRRAHTARGARRVGAVSGRLSDRLDLDLDLRQRGWSSLRPRPSSRPGGPSRRRRCRAADRFPVGASTGHSRSHHVAQRRPEVGERGARDLVERSPGRRRRCRRFRRATPPGARHEHAVAGADRAREADRALDGDAGSPPPLSHRGTTSPCARARARCGRAWSPGTPPALLASSRPSPDCLKPPNGPRRCRSAVVEPVLSA